MLGRITALAAPGIVFLPARAFARHHVWIGAPLARILDRLVHIQHDAVLRRLFDHVAVMVDHELTPVRVPFTRLIRHIARFDRVQPQRVVHRKRAVDLPLVILNPARCLVVDDQLHAFGVGVAGQLGEVVVGIALREREGVAVLDPVAVPPHVPSLDEHAADPVGRGKVDVAFGIRSRRAVLRSRAPRHRVDVHAPPDADVLHRLDPVGVGDDAGRIEIQPDHRGREVGHFVGNLNRAPWRHERRMAAHLDAVGVGREVGVQRAAVHARPAQIHFRVVHEVRLVNDNERLAVAHFHRERRLYAVECAHRRRREQLFGAIEPRPVGWDRPRARVIRHGELGQLIHDFEVAERRLRGKLVAERHAVVEGSEGDHELPIRGGGFLDVQPQLVVMITNP